MTKITIGKWGNAAAIRIPAPFCAQMGVVTGDTVEISLEGKKLIVEAANDTYTLQARMQAWDGKRFDTHEYDWGNSVGKEVW